VKVCSLRHNDLTTSSQTNYPKCKAPLISRTLIAPFVLVSSFSTRQSQYTPLLNGSDQNNNSKTEILDVAPIDVFAGLSKEFVRNFPLISPEMTKQALDVEFHWVTEHGQDGVLTAGAIVKPTVSSDIRTSHSYRVLINVARLQIMPSVRRRSNGRP
jgi:hypothetical protein